MLLQQLHYQQLQLQQLLAALFVFALKDLYVFMELLEDLEVVGVAAVVENVLLDILEVYPMLLQHEFQR